MFYNTKGRYGSNDGLSPVEFEKATRVVELLGVYESRGDSVAPNSFVRETLSHRDDAAIAAAFYEIASKVFRKPLQRCNANFSLHSTNALAGEIADDAAVPIEHFFAIFQKPGSNQCGDTSLLGSDVCMAAVDCVHVGLPWALEGGGASRMVFGHLQGNRRI